MCFFSLFDLKFFEKDAENSTKISRIYIYSWFFQKKFKNRIKDWVTINYTMFLKMFCQIKMLNF
jgi:hypothetical protein